MTQQAIQLIDVSYNNQNGKVIASVNSECLKLLQKNFDQTKPISIIAFGGNIGVGKSTALSSLCLILDNDIQQTGKEVFQSSSELSSATKGIWCFPKPLYRSEEKDVQILLIDVEGMGGIGSIPTEKQAEIEKKINLLAMILSSNYVVMTGIRPDKETIQQINQVFKNIKEIKDELEITPPELSLLIKDRDEAIQDQEKHKFINSLQESINIDESMIQKLDFYNLEQLPKKQLKQKDYRNILNEEYINSLQTLLKDISKCIKQNLVINQNIQISVYCKLIQQSIESINSESFILYFIKNLEEHILELSKPQYEQFQKNLSNRVDILMKKTDPLKTEPTKFNDEVEKCLNEEIKITYQQIKEKVPRISNSQNPKHQQLLEKIYQIYLKDIQILVTKLQKNYEQLRAEKLLLKRQQEQIEQVKQKQQQEMQQYRQQQEQINNNLKTQLQQSNSNYTQSKKQSEILQQQIQQKKQEQETINQNMIKQLQESQSQINQQTQLITQLQNAPPQIIYRKKRVCNIF